MRVAAFVHGYPPHWSMGGEVSTHRTLRELPDVVVFSNCEEEYMLDGVRVKPYSGVPGIGLPERALFLSRP